jgi:hypothetical protein
MRPSLVFGAEEPKNALSGALVLTSRLLLTNPAHLDAKQKNHLIWNSSTPQEQIMEVGNQWWHTPECWQRMAA